MLASDDKNKEIFGSFGKTKFIIEKMDINESPDPTLSITFVAKAGQKIILFLFKLK